VSIGKINVTRTLAQVEELLRQDRSISPAVRGMIELLMTIVTLMMDRLNLDSSTSSIPPSQDPKRERGAKPGSTGKKRDKRKPGGQNGHEGTTLEPVDDPDEVECIAIDKRTLPRGRYTDAGYEARQVIEILVQRHVVEYRAQILHDAQGQSFVAEFPPGVTRPIQYGGSVKVQSVYTSQQQLIPYDRVCDYFHDQCGIPISAGTIFNFNQDAFTRLEPFEVFLKAQLKHQPLLHADETGIRIGKQLHWLHDLSNQRWTLLVPHPKRGAAAMNAIGVLGDFHGRLCHDHLKAYFQFPCLHSLCNAHHLRELERAWMHDDQRWAFDMQALLLEINVRTLEAGGCLGETAAHAFRRRYRKILQRGETECPRAPGNGKRGRTAQSQSRNLLERLRDFETETLRFMTDPLVPFTNNQGENDLRMTKVQQKISGCFRSFEGAQIFCRTRSYISTCKKQGISPTEALRELFAGNLDAIIARLDQAE
jgi:transposase